MSQPSPVNRVAEYATEAGGQARSVVTSNPLPSASMAFAIGVGVGIAAVVVLSESTRSASASTTERLGQQMMDAMSNVLPRNFTS